MSRARAVPRVALLNKGGNEAMGERQAEPIAYLGLGTNLGDRLANLRWAVQLLLAAGDVALCESASLYETSPVGGPEGQANYYNSVISVRTELTPSDLLARVLGVETEMGRIRAEVNDPRTIDIDLLLYGPTVIESPMLTLPHPRLHARRFVLTPLVELAPQLVHPRLHVCMSRLLSERPSNEEVVERIYASDWISG